MKKNFYNVLFLDRDGVINRELPGDYVKTPGEFEFLPGVLEALAILNTHFQYILIVTNQRGVGRGVMTVDTLENIHSQMLRKITTTGGRIDKIYVCTDLEDSSPGRKPNIGMAWQAQQDFPGLDFSRSIMLGNSLSDMKFGKNAGMCTVLVGNKYKDEEKDVSLIDYFFEDLLSFARQI